MRIATNNLLMTIIACLITAGSTLCCQPCVNRASADPIILEKYIPYVHYKAKHVVQKITHNDIEDVRPVISGNNLAWERYADVSWCDDEGCHIIKDHQIMFRRGGVYPEKMVSSNTQFLVPGGQNNTVHEEHVELGISGDHLVWLGHHQPNEPSSWGANHFKEAIMYFDGSDYSNTAGYLLENDYDYHYEQLQINGNQVAWAANYPDSNPIYQDLDIYGYDLGASQNPYKQITQDDSHCFYPTVSPNGDISFAGNWDGTVAGAANVDIFRHQGGTTSQLNTQPAYLLSAASDTHTAWYQVDGGVLEVVQHNGLSPSVIPNTGPVVNVYGLEASGDNVAWIQSDGQSYDVRLFDGNNTNIVSNGSVDHARDLDMSGDRMTWATKEGQTDSVMFYDGLDAHEIFSGDFSIQNTGISGANLTWSVWGREYDTDEEIYAASYFGKWAQLKDVYAVELDLKDLLMTGAYMEGADLTGSDLSRTSLYEALLKDAILSSATVEGTDFSNADLTGVIGLGETVGRAKYSLRTIFPEDFDPVAAGWENLGVVPEPGTALLVVIGLIAMAANGRRRRGLEIRNAS